jgi:hypothetical protein
LDLERERARHRALIGRVFQARCVGKMKKLKRASRHSCEGTFSMCLFLTYSNTPDKWVASGCGVTPRSPALLRDICEGTGGPMSNTPDKGAISLV